MDAPLRVARGDIVVCVPVYGAYDEFAECLRSVLGHTPDGVVLLVADDCSPGTGVWDLLAGLDAEAMLTLDVFYVRHPANIGFVANMNQALGACDPADVVILNSDCVVADHWLEGLRNAAYSDTTVATATALTNNGTIVSVPERNRPSPRLPDNWTTGKAAAAIWDASLRLQPRIPTAVGHCLYIKRAALDLVGDFDMEFSPGYGEEVDFSLRCTKRGLCHVVADDVFVLHSGGASFGATQRSRIQEQHEEILRARYPLYHTMVDHACNSRTSQLARSVGVARRALKGISVTIDATCLGPTMTGTQVHALELIHALWRQGGARLRVIVPREIGADAKRRLRAMEGVAVVYLEELRPGDDRSDVIHRPYQLNTLRELTVLRQLGDRVVITQQDLIAYRNPTYFASSTAWERYRFIARRALVVADLVFFFSQHAADDALHEGVVDASRARVVHIGTDHNLSEEDVEQVAPRLAAGLDERDFLLCLGTDFHHKNRVFALAVLDQLQMRHGFTGRLALVGGRVTEGSSAGEEARFLMIHPAVERAVVHLGSIGEGEKQWFMRRSKAVLYPTTYEGFGLIPFEAAAVGVPCIFAPQASLAEVLPADAAVIVPWDAAVTADRLHHLLTNAPARAHLVETIRAAGEGYSWERTAREALALYWETAEAPPRGIPGIDGIDAPFSLVANHLVGEEGILPHDIQGALWALTRRPVLRVPVFAALRAVHRVGLAAARVRRRGTRGEISEWAADVSLASPEAASVDCVDGLPDRQSQPPRSMR